MTNSPNNSPKNNPKSQDWIKKAAHTASMGITTAQIYGHHQRVKAADSMATEAEVAAVEHIVAVNQVVSSVDNHAASHIASVAATVDVANSLPHVDVSDVVDPVDVGESAVSFLEAVGGYFF
jgi:hypothetical protein